MAKTIKFNLICDKNPVRTIEELQNNFSVEDILGYYQDGLLKKWLMVRGYTEQLEKVNRIREKDPMKILAELIRIFDMEQDNEKIKEEIEMLSLKKKREESIAYYEKQSAKESSILRDYHKKYTQLINGLLVARDDIVTIKNIPMSLQQIIMRFSSLCIEKIFTCCMMRIAG